MVVVPAQAHAQGEWPILLTVAQVAARLSISESQVRTLCRTRELDAYRLGKVWRVDARAVNEYLERCRVESPLPLPPPPPAQGVGQGRRRLRRV